MKLRTVTSIDYGHRIHNHDGQCANLHGHTGKIVIEIQGNINSETGMLIDFKEFKDKVAEVVDKYDHKMLLYKGDHLSGMFKTKDIEFVELPFIPTSERMAKDIGSQLLAKFNPTDVDIFRVEFYETKNNCAIWELGR